MSAADGLRAGELAERKAALAAELADARGDAADTVLARQGQIKDEVLQAEGGHGRRAARPRKTSVATHQNPHAPLEVSRQASHSQLLRGAEGANTPQMTFARSRSSRRQLGQDRQHDSFREEELDVEAASWEETWQSNERDLERNIGILEEDAFLADVVNQGTNLQKYAVENEAALHAKEEACLVEYTKSAEGFATLFEELTVCEDMLLKIRDVVGGFQAHLGDITGDIATLQTQSAVIDRRLKNRENALLHILPVLSKVEMVDAAWLKAVEDLPVEAPDCGSKQLREEAQRKIDSDFHAGVTNLNEKIVFLDVMEPMNNSTLYDDLMPKMLRTAGRLCQKVHAFLLTKLDSLTADTNIGVIQQTLVQKCKDIYAFLWEYNNDQANALLDQYAENMKQVFYRKTRKDYHDYCALPELKLGRAEAVVPPDTFNAKKGTENEAGSGAPGVKSGVKKFKAMATGFGMGRARATTTAKGPSAAEEGEKERFGPPFDRVHVLKAVQAETRLSVLLEQDGRTYVEDFAWVYAALINSCLEEAAFIAEFFPYPQPDRKEAILQAEFEKALAYVRGKASDWVSSASGDLVGILLLLRVCECYSLYLRPEEWAQQHPSAKDTKRCELRVPRFLVEHLTDLQSKLTHRYHEAVHAHLTSLKDANGISFAQVKVDKDVHDARHTAVHATTRRFVELACEVHRVRGREMVGVGAGLQFPVASASGFSPSATPRNASSHDLRSSPQTSEYARPRQAPSNTSIMQRIGSVSRSTMNLANLNSRDPSHHREHREPSIPISREPSVATTVGGPASPAAAGELLSFSTKIVADLRHVQRGVLKLVAALSRRYTSPTLMSVFAINNIAAVVEGFAELHEAGAADMDEELAELNEALLLQVEVFALKELQDDLGQMNRVNERYSKVVKPPETDEDYAENLAKVKTEEVIAVVNAFYSSWRQSFAALQKLTALHFPSPRTRRDVLQLLLMKFIESNEQLRTLVFGIWANPPCRQRLVSKEVLYHEMNTKYLVTHTP